MSFTHLQMRSGFSFFNSTIQIEAIVKRAKELNYDALALTDEGVLYAAIPFYKACMKAGIKPIIGLIVPVSFGEQTVSSILLAKNNVGYKELIHISTQLQLGNATTLDEINIEKTNNLVWIISTESSSIQTSLQTEQYEQLTNDLKRIGQKFADEDIYIGIESYKETDQHVLELVRQFSQKVAIPLVALHDVRYVKEEDAASYDCLQAMKENRTWEGTTIYSQHMGRHFRSHEEMTHAFSNFKDTLVATGEIAAKCNVLFSFDEQLLPSFPVPEGKTAQYYLRQLCEEQLPQKYPTVGERETERLAHELQIIHQLGFDDYFLIVADFVQFAKQEHIMVGPGRGSAAGSIVAYLLGITDVDPLAYGLLFERFLNPERVTMPDIDIDFSDIRRDEVIDYVRQKYGQDHVAQIITFGTFAARSVLRELMKTMAINEHDQAYILKHIPVASSRSIVESMKEATELQAYIKESKKLTRLFQIAIKLEGLPRHLSTHAAGIVIGSRPLTYDVPLTVGSHETYLTQYAMNELEAIGLLKMDILGLRNLTLIERIVHSIQRREQKLVDLATIPENDEATFRLLQQGRTNGVFQLESAGMKRVLTELQPTSLADIIALNALYRPGPMEHIPTYIQRKHRLEPVRYLHTDLEPILKSTYGVLIYQEQIMQIAHSFAGLSMGQADILRRAMSKKDWRAMEEQKAAFIAGCIENGYDERLAEELFRWIEMFANYGFNKSHSVAYSKIAFQLAYLKANYPTYFFAQLLNSVIGDSEGKRATYMREATELGIVILPPSINDSHAYYTVENDAIRMGLLAIKGIGYETTSAIFEVRKAGVFQDIFDFCLRVRIKRNALETLILAGAFDETYANRASLLASIDPALERADLFGGISGVGSLFNEKLDVQAPYVEMEDFTPLQKLADEKELLQTYVTNHPLKEHRVTLAIEKYSTLFSAKKLRNNQYVKIIAFIQRMKKIHTKRGDSMAFITLSDETDEMEGVIFPSVYRQISPILEEDAIVHIEGKVGERQNKKQIIVDRLRLYPLEEKMQEIDGYIYIRLLDIKRGVALKFLEKQAHMHPGKTKIIIYDETIKRTYKLGEKYSIQCNSICFEQLKEKFGTKNVVFKS